MSLPLPIPKLLAIQVVNCGFITPMIARIHNPDQKRNAPGLTVPSRNRKITLEKAKRRKPINKSWIGTNISCIKSHSSLAHLAS